MRNFAHTVKRNPLWDRDQILPVGRYPGRNHVCNFLWRSVKGFGRGKGSNSRFPIDLRRRPYKTLALPCECDIHEDAISFFVPTDYFTTRLNCLLSSRIHAFSGA